MRLHRTAFTFVLILAVSSLACSEEGQIPLEPVPGSLLEGRWLLDLRASDSSLSCQYDDVILDLIATDSIHLHGIVGPGTGTCDGHGFTAADTLLFAAQVADTVILNVARLTIVYNSWSDTLTGTVDTSGSAVAGNMVTRGTVVSDGYQFRLGGFWGGEHQPAAGVTRNHRAYSPRPY